MHRSGQTPLYRAMNLEKHLGIEKIFLKLEGNNPTGHKDDRIAEAMIRFALVKGYKKIFVHGSGAFLRSIMYFVEGTELTVFGAKVLGSTFIKKYPSINWVSFKNGELDNLVETLEKYSDENEMFLITEWERNPFVRNLALQKITEECIERVNQPTKIWVQGTGGYTLKSTYQELVRNWIKGTIDDIPQIYCAVNEKNLGQRVNELDFQENVSQTKAKLHEVDETSINAAVKLLKKLEHISVTAGEAYALAALLSTKEDLQGNNIVILNDGRNDISIKEISKDRQIDKTQIVEWTRMLLEPYHDSVEETSDAVQKAIDKGFIFIAAYGQEIQGVCVVVHMGFEDFIPTYHLAYIGVKKGNKGKGIATELINQAIEKTGGKLSLHVDIPNGKAKKLYEKMGFVHTYNRMLYKG